MIRLTNLSKSYGDHQAVKGVTLEIPSGQLVGLLGPNGAGKSTTIRMLTGMLMPSGGTYPSRTAVAFSGPRISARSL